MLQTKSSNQVLPLSRAEKTEPALNSDSNLSNIETTCSICMDDDLKSISELLICKHSFCLSCLREYLNEKIQNLQVFNIHCPHFDCKELFTEKAIKHILCKETYKKYQEAIKLKKTSNQTICSKPGCVRIIVPRAHSKTSTCTCGAKICNICYHIDHEGQSCLEAIDSKFEIYSQENDIRFCAVCKTLFRREEGCLHVTCPICDYEWCWKCGRQYHKMHLCDGNWDPIPPAELRYSKFSLAGLKNAWMKGSILKKVGLFLLILLLSPVLLFTCILFWPLYFIDVTRPRPMKSFCLIFGSLSAGIISLPITVFCLSALLIGALLALPFVGIILLADIIKGKPIYVQKTEIGKRWLSGDIRQFIYAETLKSMNTDQADIRAFSEEIENKNRKNTLFKGKNSEYKNLKEDQENPHHVIIEV